MIVSWNKIQQLIIGGGGVDNNLQSNEIKLWLERIEGSAIIGDIKITFQW
jgi:hypothetical protein